MAADKDLGSRRDILTTHVIQGDPAKAKCAVTETQLKFIAHDVTKAPPVEGKWSQCQPTVCITSQLYRKETRNSRSMKDRRSR